MVKLYIYIYIYIYIYKRWEGMEGKVRRRKNGMENANFGRSRSLFPSLHYMTKNLLTKSHEEKLTDRMVKII